MYGFNVLGINSHREENHPKSKIDSILEGAPEDLNSFKEVNEAIEKLTLSIGGLDSDKLETLANLDTTVVENSTKIADIENKLSTKIDENAASSLISKELAKIIDAAPETFDTLYEVSEWIKTHGAAAANMSAAINTNTNDISDIKENLEVLNGIDHTDYALKSDIPEEYDDSDLKNRIGALESTSVTLKQSPDAAADDPRRHIILNNNDNILGYGKESGLYNIAMISKWDVADFGSREIHMELNTKDNITVSLGNGDTETVAYKSDIEEYEDTILKLEEKIEELEAKLNNSIELKATDAEGNTIIYKVFGTKAETDTEDNNEITE